MVLSSFDAISLQNIVKKVCMVIYFVNLLAILTGFNCIPVFQNVILKDTSMVLAVPAVHSISGIQYLINMPLVHNSNSNNSNTF